MTTAQRLLVDELKTIVATSDQNEDPSVVFGNYHYYLTKAAREAAQSGEDDRLKDFNDRSDRCDAVLEIMKEAEAKLVQELNEKGFPEFATALQKRCYRSLVIND